MGVTTEQLIIELNKRNLKLEHIMEYIKFEDECIEKGFTFNSLIEAREKQIPKKPYEEYGALHCRACGQSLLLGEDNYCPTCGQAIDWSE